MEAFNFVQDFYLHFAQFYAHTGYALLISFISLSILKIGIDLPIISGIWLMILYFLIGLFFVIGRIQLTTLFIAERALIAKSKDGK
jgi:hypothetical protein